MGILSDPDLQPLSLPIGALPLKLGRFHAGQPGSLPKETAISFRMVNQLRPEKTPFPVEPANLSRYRKEKAFPWLPKEPPG
jgi:hypothetical protein